MEWKTHKQTMRTNPFVDGEYGADGRQAVDVTGTVQGVEADHVLPL